jgi:hypothetical protein
MCFGDMPCPLDHDLPVPHDAMCPDDMPCQHDHDLPGPHDGMCLDGDTCPHDLDLPGPYEPPFPPEQVAPLPEPQCLIHVIQRGDTLSTIAAAYGSEVYLIVADNNIANPNVIYVGHELLICEP